MARIAGINIPSTRGRDRSDLHLRIGRSTSNEVLVQADVDPNTYVKDLTEDEVRKLREKVDDLLVEGDLRRERSQNVKRLMEIGSYKGLRHRRGLPANGQRTKTNARTAQGPKRGASTGGGKKKIRKQVRKQQDAPASTAAWPTASARTCPSARPTSRRASTTRSCR